MATALTIIHDKDNY